MAADTPPVDHVIEAIRYIERQQAVSGYASALAWRQLELAMIGLDGQDTRTLRRRLDRVFSGRV